MSKMTGIETEKTRISMPQVYLPPTGGPLYWRDEESGILKEAVWAFINHNADNAHPAPSAGELSLLRDYLKYYINAPCWNFSDNAFSDELAMLQVGARAIKTNEDICKWLTRSLEIGIDPL